MKVAAAAILSLAVVLVLPGPSSADPPVIGASPSDLVVEAANASGRAVSFAGPQATDDHGTPVVSCNPTSGTVFPIGKTHVSCIADDPVTGEQSGPVTFSVRVLPHAQERASRGAVSALFYYRKTSRGGIADFKDVRLVIVRSNRVAYDASVRPYPGGFGTVWPGGSGSTRKSVSVRDLEGDGEPEVLLDLYWGGAHCCWWTDFYRYASGAYSLRRHLWGDVSYRVVDFNHDGRPELKSADDRFAYAFTSFAESGFPLQIWSYRSGRFVDVTRRFPAELRRDAASQWRYSIGARRQRLSVRGVLAAWAADECLLRRCAGAFKRLQSLAAADG